MKPTLLILAAGMGSRYGGLKQLDPVGPSGETLLDYSVFDAIRAGFDRVVFVIRRDFEQEFRERIGRRYEHRVDVDYVFQGVDVLPPGHAVPETRRKPLGTGHAIWCARESVTAPFAAINADDFYGADAYRTLARFFSQPDPVSDIPQFAMVGYRLGRTLSEHGSVARGVCQVDRAGYLQTIEECVGIEKTEAGAHLTSAGGTEVTFGGNEIVSMNFWGFTPAVFPMLEQGLGEFLNHHAADEKAEFYIPVAVAKMIASGSARVSVLSSESSWFGVTYRDDRALVAESIARLVEAGNYPSNLGEGISK
jgi:dTDP-glucose pyrophosphorylase